MPMMPVPALRICLTTPITVSASASMWAPTGLRRTRSISTQSDAAAAARRASMEWQETPWARMMPFCLASESTSMTPRYRVVQSPSVVQ